MILQRPSQFPQDSVCGNPGSTDQRHEAVYSIRTRPADGRTQEPSRRRVYYVARVEVQAWDPALCTVRRRVEYHLHGRARRDDNHCCRVSVHRQRCEKLASIVQAGCLPVYLASVRMLFDPFFFISAVARFVCLISRSLTTETLTTASCALAFVFRNRCTG